jgi:hypothetical protein
MKERFERRHDLQGDSERQQITAIAAALTEAGTGAFEVADFFEESADLAEEGGLSEEGSDHFLALGEQFQIT